jgi:anti-anti-sigma regulatory factor
MTCKIDRVLTPDGFIVLRVSGRIDGTHVEMLRELTDGKTTKGLAIDLTEVTLVSREAVEVLTLAEASGIELKNCPAYVREWVSRHRESADTEVDHDA